MARDTYVDNGVTGRSKAEVARMKGHRLGNGSYYGSLAKILGKMKIKDNVTTGETDEELKDLIWNKVLGY